MTQLGAGVSERVYVYLLMARDYEDDRWVVNVWASEENAMSAMKNFQELADDRFERVEYSVTKRELL